MEVYPVIECLTPDERAGAFAIRRAVFVVEMQIDPAVERDGRDADAAHFLALADGRAVGAGRYVRDGDTIKLGRIAVLPDYRRQGVGRALVRFMLDHARRAGATRAFLHAQASARAFYFAIGFVEEGTPFIEAGIPHISMSLDLSNS
ncbi:MAG: GNAT family N-acetyltransferase [Myxococcales bacterium]|nr:MAG: GNAT family N-acetyltransferase [Myxococcales bacterium]